MKMAKAFTLLSACSTLGFALSATPISKVIQLLDDMKAKGTSEKKEEAVRYSAFEQWCGDQTRIKTNEINDGSEKIEMLAAGIQKATVHIRSLTDRILELEEDVSGWKKDKKGAIEIREKEAADYVATSVDYSESLDALAEALATLGKRAHNVPQAELAQVLLQVRKMDTIPKPAHRALVALLQQPSVEEMPDQQLFYEAPEAYGYEFQSGGVMDVLEKLKAEFESKKYELDKDEQIAKHASEDLRQMLSDNIDNANHEIDKKTRLRAEVQESKAELKGEKAQTEADRAEDQEYFDGLKALCSQKKEDFMSRQELRAGELDALSQALDIMRSETVSGAGDQHLPSLVQRSAMSLAQLRNGNSDNLPSVQDKVAVFLADRAKLINSRTLLLASQGASANPFVKVKKMIKDLISKLTQEFTEETEHKGWCDTELTTNKQTRDRKTEAVEQLTSTKEDLQSTIAELTQDIADLTEAVAKLDQAMAEMTKNRKESNEKNEATIADAKAAQTAMEEAIAILKDFYAKSAQATSLSQVGQTPIADAPETFDKPYQGMMVENGNVVDFLQVIHTDFVRLGSETATQEAVELDEYKRFMLESAKDKALKQTEKKNFDGTRQDKEGALAATETELKMTQTQLDKALGYYEKLKPSCVGTGITYEDRVKRREEEIQSLQEALKILTGTDLS